MITPERLNKVLTYLPVYGMLRTVSNQEENKEERIDELDVIGGLLFTLIRKAFNRIKLLLHPRKVE